VDDTAEERIDKANNAREIVHKNTRFTLTPYNVDKNKQSLSGAQARVLSGQIGPDGKEILPAQSPRVGGYGFVATPSPAPGKMFTISPAPGTMLTVSSAQVRCLPYHLPQVRCLQYHLPQVKCLTYHLPQVRCLQYYLPR